MIFGTHNIHKLPEILEEAYLSKAMVVEVWSKVQVIYGYYAFQKSYPHFDMILRFYLQQILLVTYNRIHQLP
jgi:hypothetical protein